MTKILHHLPIVSTPSTVRFQDRHVRVYRDQILIWVSVRPRGFNQDDTKAPCLPALLDTGNNFDFSLNEHHLVHWAGVSPGSLAVMGSLTMDGQSAVRRAGSVWLHRNRPCTRDAMAERAPHRLEMSNGIAVFPFRHGETVYPRLPLLGLPALLNNNLSLWLDPRRRQVY